MPDRLCHREDSASLVTAIALLFFKLTHDQVNRSNLAQIPSRLIALYSLVRNRAKARYHKQFAAMASGHPRGRACLTNHTLEISP